MIKELSGTVELKAAGASAFSPATTGVQVKADTIISTGFKSTALVEIGSAVITVQPLTRLALSEISASAGMETLNMNLQAGRVRVDVNPPAGAKAALSVSSPSATAPSQNQCKAFTYLFKIPSFLFMLKNINFSP